MPPCATRVARLAPLVAATACITELPEVADPCATWEDPGLYTLHVEHDGKRRLAYVDIPPDVEGPRDVVVAMHGAASDARTMADITGLIGQGRKEGYVAVFPQGLRYPIRRAWNAGECCGSADEKGTDDVGFLNALVDELTDRACTDRVVATGFSNGGMLTHRWACESNRVDVAVPIGGTEVFEGTCKGGPVPIRHYHGSADPIVPPDGDENFPPLEPTFERWLDRNDCDDSPPSVETDGTMTCTAWSCAVPTELCLIEGWDHRWPGGIYANEVGMDATKEAWDFFLQNAPPR